MNIYILRSDVENFSFFLENSTNLDNLFYMKHKNWGDLISSDYSFVLHKSENGKKNYNFDISVASRNLIIFSEKAINVLKSTLLNSGNIVDIKTDSKKKLFYGFYPNKKVYSNNILNKNKSNISHVNNKLVVYKPILNNEVLEEDILFSIEGYTTGCFVTDKFKKIVEDNGLVGFDFTEIVYEE